jgi:hypothetical protein
MSTGERERTDRPEHRRRTPTEVRVNDETRGSTGTLVKINEHIATVRITRNHADTTMTDPSEFLTDLPNDQGLTSQNR